MAITAATSTLGSAANNIIRVNIKSETSFRNVRNDFQRFGDFLDSKIVAIEREQLPSQNKLKALGNLNLVNTFGSAGGLLGSLLSGALDVGGFVRGLFSGKDNKMGTTPKGTVKTAPKPKMKGSRLRIPGMRAAPIVGAIFAGLDFATGLAEGESIGKSAAGTAGALAGSMLGGVIGQTLIPVPGLGFVVGSAVGGMLGGWTADRAYEAGESMMSKAQKKQEEKLKESSSKKSQTLVSSDSVIRQNSLINNFEESTNKFVHLVNDIIDGRITLFESPPMDEASSPGSPANPQQPGGEDGDEYIAEGGSLPSKNVTSPYGWRSRYNRMHHGVDYAVSNPTSPISVIMPGKVVFARWDDGGYGNAVSILHPNGVESFYGHLSKINVKEGQEILSGTVIGNQGNTGRSDGPHVHFELRPAGTGGGYGKGMKIPNNAGDAYFRFGGSIKVSRRARPGTEPPGTLPTSNLKPGKSVQTPFGIQSSMPAASRQANMKNFKGYLIVPGHITGDGAKGEMAAVEKIAKYVVSKIKAEFPGVPVELWNNRNYEMSDAGFRNQLRDLQKKEQEGWQVIELHYDAPGGTGRGLISPSQINPLEQELAKFGAYPLGFRDLGGPKHGFSLYEIMNMTPELKQAFERGDPKATEYSSRDLLNALRTTILKGEMPGYTPPSRARVSAASQQTSRDISYTPEYNRSGGGNVNNTFVAFSQPQPQARASSPIAAPSGGGSGGIQIVSTGAKQDYSSILDHRLGVA